MIKFIFTFLFLISCNSTLFSQTYTRGSKNIGFGVGYGFAYTNSHQWAFTGQNPGNTYSVRATRNLKKYFYPSLNYYYHQHGYITQNASSLKVNNNFNYHTVAPSVGLQIPLLNLYKTGSCRFEGKQYDTFFNGGIEWDFNTGYKSDSTFSMNDNFSFQYGLGFVLSGSGSSKSKQSKDIFINLYNKRSIGPTFNTNNENLILFESFWGIELLVIIYKTYKFSDM